MIVRVRASKLLFILFLDQEGIVRWAHAERDYKVRPSALHLLSVIDSLHLPKAAAK